MVADRSNTRGGVGAVEAVAEPAAKPAKPKEKRRNNEKRKEKSRDAARTRRSRECEIFTDLGEALPLAKEEVDQLDKASVMRLAIAYLKVRDMVDTVAIKSESPDQSLPEEDVKPTPDALLGNEAEQMLIKALDGFILVLSEDGDITYVSENITEILGLHQIDILSQPIWDYAHQCDHEELRHVLSQKRGPNDVDGPKTGSDLFLRLKCTLTSRGRNVNIKSASFKVIHVKGHVVMNEETNKKLFVAIGRPIPHPSNIEVPLGSQMFLTKHALDMKFTYVDEKLTALLNYQASVLMGKSLFDYHHGGDSEHLRAAFKCLLSKGQMETRQYRFLASRGGYAWIVTQATIVYDKQKPQSVVCVNYLISGIENEHEVYSLAQLEARPSLTPKEASSAATIRSGQQQQTVNQGRNNKEEKKQQQQRNTCSEPQKVQKNPKSVRIVEPPQPIKTRVAPAFNQNNNTCQSVGALNTVPGNNSFSVAVNRPRSVTDALFAAAPEVVATTPAVAVASVAAAATTTVATEQQQPRRSTLQQQQLPEDMNKGFLQFAEVDPELTMLKEEVDDLSHLAPTPGDACIPLDETTSFLASYEELNDLIDNYIYGDGVTGFEAVSASADIPTGSSSSNSNSSSSCSSHSDSNSQHSQHQQSNQHHHQQTDSYFAEPKRTAGTASQQDEMTMVHKVAPLLKDAIISENVFAAAGLDLMDSVMESAVGVVTGVEKKMDPFITYRDESSDASVATSHLLSPDDCSMQSPDGSLPSSLCSPSESYGDEDLAFMTSISMEDDMDLSMRAPYISMSEADDLPLLISEDLMWGALPTTCDAPKFVQEPKMNVVVDVAAVQVVNGGNAAGQVDKTGDFLLSSNTQNEVLQQRQQQQSNSRRRKSGGHFAEEMRSAKAMPLVNLLLQPVSGEAAGALNGQQLIAVVSNGSNSCSSTEDATHSDVIEPMFEEAMTKNCSTPAADMHAWSTFSEFMVMDSTGCEGQLYSSECNSPFTSTSSMDSIGGAPQHEEKVASKKQSRKETGSHKRTLSNASASNGLGLKEMLCGGGGVGGADVGVRNGVPSAMSQAKRIKCDNDQPRSASSVVMNTLTSASPQLLQQLMAPTKSTAAKVKVVEQQQQQSRKTGNDASMKNNNDSKAQEDQESKKGFAMLSKKQQQAPAPSNSVLMNLLSPLHIEAPPNILNDPLLMSALSFDSSLSSPNLLRANPLIGGDQQLTPNTSMDESMFMATSLPFLHDEASILCGRDSRPGDLKRSPSPVDDFLGSMYID